MKYSHLFFDADGTLFDYDKAEAKALAATFEQKDLPFLDSYSAIYREINEQMWKDFELGKISQLDLRSARFGRLLEAFGIEGDEKVFGEAYLKNLGNGTDLIDGAVETLEALQGKYRLLLITNGIPEVQRSRLAQSPIGDFFESVIISGEIGIAKPKPGIFDAAFETMRNPPIEETIIIGDSLSSDIQGGVNYGIDTCWFNPNKIPPDPIIKPTHQIHTLDQLLDLLGAQ